MPTETATDPKTTTTTKEAPVHDDFLLKTILGDIGKTLKDGKLEDLAPAAPDPKDVTAVQDFTTMGEAARYKAERDAKNPEDKTTEDADKKKAEEEAKAKQEAEEKAAKEAADKKAAEEAKPEKKKVEVEKERPLEELVEEAVLKLSPTTTAPKPTAETTTSPAPGSPKTETAAAGAEDPITRALSEEEQDELALAEYAAKQMPDRYKDLPGRMKTYIKKVDEYIEKRQEEDPEWNAEQDPKFAAFVEENQPKYERGDRRKLERQQITSEVAETVRAEFQPKIEEAERVVKAQETAPKIEQVMEPYDQFIVEQIAGDDKTPLGAALAPVKAEGHTPEAWAKAAEADKLAVKVVKKLSGEVKTLAKRYLEIDSGVVKFDRTNPEHTALFAWIDNQEAEFSKNGPKELQSRDGKVFVTHKQWHGMPEAERAKHWTSGPMDVLTLLSIYAKNAAQNVYTARVKELEEDGYVRQAKTAGAKKEEKKADPTPKPTESPKATTTIAPGAAQTGKGQQGQSMMTEEELKHYWEGGAAVIK